MVEELVPPSHQPPLRLCANAKSAKKSEEDSDTNGEAPFNSPDKDREKKVREKEEEDDSSDIETEED